MICIEELEQFIEWRCNGLCNGCGRHMLLEKRKYTIHNFSFTETIATSVLCPVCFLDYQQGNSNLNSILCYFVEEWDKGVYHDNR